MISSDGVAGASRVVASRERQYMSAVFVAFKFTQQIIDEYYAQAVPGKIRILYPHFVVSRKTTAVVSSLLISAVICTEPTIRFLQ